MNLRRTPALARKALPITSFALLTLPSGAVEPSPPSFVVAKVQLVYSVVSHYSHVGNRIIFYSTKGSPAGNANYVVPFLVCDPLVTLYNPTNATVSTPRARITIWDPPVGFKFKKNGDYLRQEFAEPDGFLPMARFQAANENNAAVRKSFTLYLTEPGAAQPYGRPLKLLAGQSVTYGAVVENAWTWGFETAAEFSPRSFYDWNVNNDFTNRDGRTSNSYGVESTPDLDFRAGFQVDHLSTSSNRPAATLYDFETANDWTGGWVAIKQTDTFTVEAKPMRAHPASSLPDFNVGVLKGNNVVPTSDIQRAFPMSVSGLTQQPAIQRQFLAGDLLQSPADKTIGGKTPIAVVTMIAKSKALQENRFYGTPSLPAPSLYDLRFDQLTDFGYLETIRSSDVPQEGFKVTGVQRIGNEVFLDVQAAPEVFGLRVMGTASLEQGFTENLNSRITAIPGPSGSGIYKIILNVSDKGPNYFLRIEDDEP